MQEALERIKKQCENLIKECQSAEIDELATHLSYGKMLRSKLLLSISGINEDSVNLCAIIELIQTASLLHDDVIDESSIRRGKPSINASFGNKNAIMLGDTLYSKAFYELTKFDTAIAQSVANAVVRLSIGEISDVRLSSSFNTDKNRYLQMCKDKTAALIVAAAECGALLKGLDAQKYRIYGENLGIAFQIVDDILDITQDSSILGKPNMSDFKEGKTTLPYIFLYEHLNDNDRQILLSYFAKELNDAQIQWLKTEMEKCGAITMSIEQVKKYASQSLESIKDENNQKLESVIMQMLKREF
uniref:Octaprenyl-diphosphate synthase n=1 Tax=uncultured Helicobacter sp. TaxID=175537 RepID=A0A650EMJ2_9HELI|nr:octaprenyl-diphosphate synthase [uncultured Helicobacter sp.]